MTLPTADDSKSRKCLKDLGGSVKVTLRSAALLIVFAFMGGSVLAAPATLPSEYSSLSSLSSRPANMYKASGEHIYTAITASIDAYNRMISGAGEEIFFLISHIPNPSLSISNTAIASSEQVLSLYEKGISSYVYIAPAIPSNFLSNISTLGVTTSNLVSAAANLASYSLIEHVALGTYQVLHNFFSGIGDTLGLLFVPAPQAGGSRTQ